MTSWQPIETAPKDGTRVEGYSTFTGQLSVTRFVGRGHYKWSEGWEWRHQEDGKFSMDSPSHWRALPTREKP